MMARNNPTPWWRRGVFLVPLGTVALLVAMFFNTTFVGAGQQAQAADTAVEYAQLNYSDVIVPAIVDKAQDLAPLAEKIVADPEAAGEEFGRHEDAGKPYSYAVTATGTVEEGEFGEVALAVDGMPDGVTVGVAIPPLGSSTALRDAGTDLTFGSFTNQTEYQNVAIELNKLAATEVYADLKLADHIGQQITVTGALTWSSKTGGAVSHVTIIPVAIEVQS